MTIVLMIIHVYVYACHLRESDLASDSHTTLSEEGLLRGLSEGMCTQRHDVSNCAGVRNEPGRGGLACSRRPLASCRLGTLHCSRAPPRHRSTKVPRTLEGRRLPTASAGGSLASAWRVRQRTAALISTTTKKTI